ncbi:MAG: sigma-70 family RNA polymerase sigma factor [Defluviitaleaceae bacterium]|nr:sigma-70 family RNA polymerase sigma factor [Defluviitaleaceae bacterium]
MQVQMLSAEIRTATEAERELERLVEHYGNGLLKYTHSVLLDYHEAQDVVQSTFVMAFAALNRNAQIHSSWLYKSAYNKCIDILRRKRLQRLFLSRQQEESYTPDYFISENVEQILHRLNPKDRALVYSRAVEGLSYEQLSEIYGKGTAALRKQYERAKKKLLENSEGGDLP